MKHDGSPTYGDVVWLWLMRGVPREEALFQADEWEKRKKREEQEERFGKPAKLNRASRRKMKEPKP